MMLGLAGCGSTPKWAEAPRVLNETQRTALGRIAVVADSEPPALVLDGYSQGRLAGGMTGYSGSFRVCMGATGAWALAQASYTPGYALYWATSWAVSVVPCGVVALAGFPAGWALAPADETLSVNEERVISAVHRQASAVPLRRELVRRLQAEPLPKGITLVSAKDAPDTLLQLSVTAVRLQGPGWGNRPLSVVMEAQVHCLAVPKAGPNSTAATKAESRTEEDTSAPLETCHIPLRFVGPSPKRLSAWAANDGAAMRQVLQAGIEQFATQTQAALLKSTPPKDPPKARRGEYF
jgi:hypothetical protein